MADSGQQTSPDRPQVPPSGAPARRRSSLLAPKNLYLVAYNFTSAILWATILGRVLLVSFVWWGPRYLPVAVGSFSRWTQTLAALEILHAAVGLVRAPVVTTGMQVASRLLLVWGIVDRYGRYIFDAGQGWGWGGEVWYASMLIAWSVTEVIRYGYFATLLSTGRVGGVLMWLRYNAFYVLYPLGITSECMLIWKAIPAARSQNLAFEYILKLILFIYIPGSYVLFTHMMAQRRKVMRGKAQKEA